MPDFTYHRPETLDEALAVLQEYAGEAKVLAGGQSLLPVMALRLSQPAHVVDIGQVRETAGITPRTLGKSVAVGTR